LNTRFPHRAAAFSPFAAPAEARMVDRIPRNEAIEVWGKARFGGAWVGELSTEEYEPIQKYKLRNGTRPRVPPAVVDQLYVAEERAARSDRQHGEVNHWLENHGLDCVRGLKDGLDRELFEAAFQRDFGKKPETMSPRDRAILNRLNAGKRPGKNEYWKVFQGAIEAEIGLADGTSIKQLRRAVTRLMREHRLN
jgi:hypothetical protein